MKKANGIVLDKPGKPDYRKPSAFRIIVLLETVSKILDRLSALRLASAARSLGLLHPNQCGCLASLGCFDAVATLTQEVRLLQAAAFKVSTLFLDVNGGFDNVCTNKLATILTRGGVSMYLVAWIKSFLSKHPRRLIFQGAPKVFCRVAVGTPQASPISPLLFVIYIACLHPTLPQGLAISYVDDLTITVGSDLVRSNIRALQYYFGSIQSQGANLGMAFSVPKTELIHWRTPKDRSDVSFPIVINDMLFPPSQVVRWLGYWLTPTLHSSVHFLRWLACGAPMDNQLLLHDRPRRSVPVGQSTTHLLNLQTPLSVSYHPPGLPPSGIEPCHCPDTRVCAHLGPRPFCGRSSLSPPRVSESGPPYFMAWPGG